jgi:hypothetical protein
MNIFLLKLKKKLVQIKLLQQKQNNKMGEPIWFSHFFLCLFIVLKCPKFFPKNFDKIGKLFDNIFYISIERINKKGF